MSRFLRYNDAPQLSRTTVLPLLSFALRPNFCILITCTFSMFGSSCLNAISCAVLEVLTIVNQSHLSSRPNPVFPPLYATKKVRKSFPKECGAAPVFTSSPAESLAMLGLRMT
ncbi:hypothetical protein SCHPADRAFT_749325 [Schizopora paradoxa]|uniref:Uncharacterized protein n=1 Tax=Schizopora paradoxa TaxID=27342 RepID=A0A0H2QZ12_9AGAM|nr:hypothetical protein SCHPADRAFT_749325 [Schizopora paradoxa]